MWFFAIVQTFFLLPQNPLASLSIFFLRCFDATFGTLLGILISYKLRTEGEHQTIKFFLRVAVKQKNNFNNNG